MSQSLDLLTSILLSVEEVHDLGYAVNDLKNGNLMVSRRGQLKGIDLDAFSLINHPADKVTDFFFLAATLLLFFLNTLSRCDIPNTVGERLLTQPGAVRKAIEECWALGDVSLLSEGRVDRDEVLDLLTDVINRSRDHTYAHDPGLFHDDIDRVIRLKRRIFLEEIVLD
ncbi:MAG: hypothetical protein AAF492_33645 [Verrucomicrobiota bacterium]